MNWLDPVTLSGRHIRLEPLDPAIHAGPMFAHFESRVTDFMARGGGAPIATEQDLRRYLEDMNTLPHRRNWAVRVIATGDVAGRISYSDVNESNRWIEIGTMLMPAFWGGPANPEGKLLLMTRAFEALNINRVQFKVDARNGRSQGSMAKLGAVREGVLREYQIQLNGYKRDSVVYSVLSEEWPDVKAKLLERLSVD